MATKSAASVIQNRVLSMSRQYVIVCFFDQFVKHGLRARYYIRYTDDFVILSEDRMLLRGFALSIQKFLQKRLRLNLHPRKVFIKTLTSGVDFLGWLHFPDHRVLRRITKRRMMRRLRENPKPETITSYLGLLGHGNTYRLRGEMFKIVTAEPEI